MEIYQNFAESIQGNWSCKNALNPNTGDHLTDDFSLLISDNLISRSGNADQFWPAICNFEPVGSSKDGYFYREDGCFIQVKSISENEIRIELSSKDSTGQLNSYIFYFDRIVE